MTILDREIPSYYDKSRFEHRVNIFVDQLQGCKTAFEYYRLAEQAYWVNCAVYHGDPLNYLDYAHRIGTALDALHNRFSEGSK